MFVALGNRSVSPNRSVNLRGNVRFQPFDRTGDIRSCGPSSKWKVRQPTHIDGGQTLLPVIQLHHLVANQQHWQHYINQ